MTFPYKFCVMLICGNSTELCKTVEIFVYTKFIPGLSTLFPGVVVEKPVENVDNSQINTASLTFYF